MRFIDRVCWWGVFPFLPMCFFCDFFDVDDVAVVVVVVAVIIIGNVVSGCASSVTIVCW